MIYVALALLAAPAVFVLIVAFPAPLGWQDRFGFHLGEQFPSEGEPTGFLGVGGADFIPHNDGDRL